MFVFSSRYLDITVVLPFMRTVKNKWERIDSTPLNETSERGPARLTGIRRIRFQADYD